MNLSGKHFEFAGVSSSDPLGDGSVSLIFAHIDTEMNKQPFGYPEYSSVYSDRAGKRGLTGANRNDSCLEFEQEIVSEKGGIPLAKLRQIEQWLFSREAFAKLYIAEAEEDAEDVQYINGEKKRLYLNCMLTEPEILTYAEGKVGWKVKVVCDAPWAWQDEHTQTIYNGGSGWYEPVPTGTAVATSGGSYIRKNNAFMSAKSVTIPSNMSLCGVYYDGSTYSTAGAIYAPGGDEITLIVDTTLINIGPYGYVDIDGVRVAQKNYSGGDQHPTPLTYTYVVPAACICVVTETSEEVIEGVYANGINVSTTEQIYDLVSGSTLPAVYVNSDINTYIYPDSVTLVCPQSQTHTIYMSLGAYSSSVSASYNSLAHTTDFSAQDGGTVTVRSSGSGPLYRVYMDGEMVDEDPASATHSFTANCDYTVTAGTETYEISPGTVYYAICAYIVTGNPAHPGVISLVNATDDMLRSTELSYPLAGTAITIVIRNNGTITDTYGNNMLPYMTSRNFPRLISGFSNGSIGLQGANRISVTSNVGSASFTFRNRRFLS